MAKSEEPMCTYKSGNCQTVIDYTMLRREGLSSVKNCKVTPGTQHRLLVMDLTVRKRKRVWRERIKEIN